MFTSLSIRTGSPKCPASSCASAVRASRRHCRFQAPCRRGHPQCPGAAILITRTTAFGADASISVRPCFTRSNNRSRALFRFRRQHISGHRLATEIKRSESNPLRANVSAEDLAVSRVEFNKRGLLSATTARAAHSDLDNQFAPNQGIHLIRYGWLAESAACCKARPGNGSVRANQFQDFNGVQALHYQRIYPPGREAVRLEAHS